MEIIKVLNSMLSQYEERLEVAEVQLMNGYTKGWYREKKVSENSIELIKKLIKTAQKDSFAGINVGKLYDIPGLIVPRLCWSNYRVMLFPDNRTGFVTPFFWTPELGIENSHHEIWKYAMSFRDENNHLLYDPDYRWGGFYTYGLGNGDQEQLTLYGESSDYPHNEWSEKVKECFLKGSQFLPEIIESEIEEELPF